MVKVAIVGASGYTGVELIRILLAHPEVSLTCLTSEQSAGKRVSEVFPSLRSRCELVLEPLLPEQVAAKADVIFTALPHQAAMDAVPAFLERGRKVIDLSADYRLKDTETYGTWYGPHRDVTRLAEAVYGLPELHRKEIVDASLVANPGCYPTSIILALAPLLRNGVIDPASIIADSGSGVSGAGRSAKVDTLYCEVNEGFKAYGVGGSHRHTPEIEQELSMVSGVPLTVTFTPHLVPMDRGILSTCYAVPVQNITSALVQDLYETTYCHEPFVRVLPKGALPSTAFVRGSNFCDVAPVLDERTGRIIVVSAIDNLVKGAAGQAVQNMNIICGFPETQGLEVVGLFP